MKIEHIALWTNDLERLKTFYTEFFQGEAGNKYHNIKRGFESYFIRFESGARLEIMKLPNLITRNYAESETNIGFAHFAFSVGSNEKVSELTEILRAKGHRIVSEPRTTGDGYYESCVLDPDGNEIEITR